MRKLTVLAAICALFVFGVVACRKQLKDLDVYKPVANSKKDTIGLYNVLPLIQKKGYVLYVNDTLQLATGTFARASNSARKFILPNYIATSSFNGQGLHIKLVLQDEIVTKSGAVTLTPPPNTPDPNKIIYERDIPAVTPGSGGYVLFFYGTTGNVKSKIIKLGGEATSPPAQGSFKLRVVNFGYDAGPQYAERDTFAVQLQNQEGASIGDVERIGHGSESTYKEFPFGSYQFKLMNLRNSNLLNGISSFLKYFQINPTRGEPLYYPEFYGGVKENVKDTNLDSIPNIDFLPGRIYSLFVIGPRYVLNVEPSDVQSSVAKLQWVNAETNLPDVSIHVSSRSFSSDLNLSYKQYTEPIVVPSGVDLTIKVLSKGNILYETIYNPGPLSHACFYLIQNTKGFPDVYRQNVQVAVPGGAFVPNINKEYSTVGITSTYDPTALTNIYLLNLIANAGKIAFSYVSEQNVNSLVNTTRTGTEDIDFKNVNIASSRPYDATFNFNPLSINAFLSFNRTDDLAGKALVSLPFPLQGPGVQSAVLVGDYDNPYTEKQPAILIIKHTNNNR